VIHDFRCEWSVVLVQEVLEERRRAAAGGRAAVPELLFELLAERCLLVSLFDLVAAVEEFVEEGLDLRGVEEFFHVVVAGVKSREAAPDPGRLVLCLFFHVCKIVLYAFMLI